MPPFCQRRAPTPVAGTARAFLDMDTVKKMRGAIVNEDAAGASTRVLEGAITLCKAEVHLAISELLALLQRAAVPAGLLWAAGSATQVAIALVCMSPLLVTIWDAPIVLSMIVLSVGIAVVLGVVGARRMRAALTRPATAPESKPDEISVSPQAMQPGGT
jgi:Putative Actinobacterial Holin-X, holin superfamily III